MRNIRTGIVCAMLALSLGACQGTQTSASTAQDTVGAAVGSLFQGESQSASLKRSIPGKLLAFLISEAHAQAARTTACESLAEEETPSDIETTAGIEAGDYGTVGHSISVTSADGCSEGGEYASFNVGSHELDCSLPEGESATVTMTDSSGVWRENLDTLQTEIYGTFTITMGSETVSNVRCYLTIDHSSEDSEGLFGGECESEAGDAFQPSDEVSCSDNS